MTRTTQHLLLLVMLLSWGCYGTLDMEENPYSQNGSGALESGQDETPSTPSSPSSPNEIPSPDHQPTGSPDAGYVEPDMPGGELDNADAGMGSPDVGMEEVDMRPAPGSIVEFEIVEGTGADPWNTPEEAVVVYVGQILRITNLDSRDHQLHAGDDAAVDHGSRMVPGQSQDFDVMRAMPLGDRPQLYDHADGRSAAFWVEARE